MQRCFLTVNSLNNIMGARQGQLSLGQEGQTVSRIKPGWTKCQGAAITNKKDERKEILQSTDKQLEYIIRNMWTSAAAVDMNEEYTVGDSVSDPDPVESASNLGSDPGSRSRCLKIGLKVVSSEN
jgi:hypothetical protein